MTTLHSNGESRLKRACRFLGGALAGYSVVALFGFAGFVLHFNAATVGFLFLLVVATVAILAGFWQATVVSILACSILDYFFYHPLFVFSIADPQDWIALGSFEISALVVSQLSAKERRNSDEAKLQRIATEQLYELSRRILLINLQQAPGPELTKLIQRIFSLEAVALFNSESATADATGSWNEDGKSLAVECFERRSDSQDLSTLTSLRVLKMGSVAVGALAVRGTISPLAFESVASMTAVTLDRYASFQKESRSEAAHQAERLRAGVLDSLAHAFKTPLTAIQAANSGLPQVGALNEPQRELVELIGDACTGLVQLCTRLLQTAKLDAQELRPGTESIVIKELVSKVMKGQSGSLGDRMVDVVIDPDLTIQGDAELLSMALTQYLDNAAKYSFPGTKVQVAVQESRSEVLISVHNYGPVIPICDRERVFHRFYRCAEARETTNGTGVGLSTVKLAADVHRGHAWVISDEDQGTTFYLSLPS
jgi:two-component system, OmpR family, sensor histidine kinase KdpD